MNANPIKKVKVTESGVVLKVETGENQYKVAQFGHDVVEGLVKRTATTLKKVGTSIARDKSLAGRKARRHFRSLVEGTPISELN